jgi:hypothetical protein
MKPNDKSDSKEVEQSDADPKLKTAPNSHPEDGGPQEIVFEEPVPIPVSKAKAEKIEKVAKDYVAQKAEVREDQKLEESTIPTGPHCPKCKSTALGMAGGLRHCNSCGFRWE